MQKGSVSTFFLVGVLVLLLVIIGVYFFGKFRGLSIRTQTIPKNDSLQSVVEPMPIVDETANWKIYTAKNNEFSFKYPADWYYEPVPGYEAHEVSFFLNGTKADHGYGDHKGNEVFTVDITDDDRSLQLLKNNYYPDASFTTIADKPTLKTSFGLIIVKVSGKSQLTIVGGLKAAESYTEKILSTFKFTQ